MTAYDRWLEKPFQEACEREEAISDIVEQLMEDELNPRNPNVFMQAIHEGACLDNKTFNAALKDILDAKNYDELGKLVYDFVVDYCQNTAVLRAEALIKYRSLK